MPTTGGSFPFRFLLFLVVRLRRSTGSIVLALRARFASFWRSILLFARRGDYQSQIRLHASNAGAVDNNPGRGESLQTPAGPKAQVAEGSGTLAALPVRGIAHRQDELSKHQALSPGHHFKKFHADPAIPENVSQRYKPGTASQTAGGPPDIPIGQRTLLTALPQLPDSWRRHIHPEGNMFFYHEGLRLFTDTNIVNQQDILFYATTLIQQAMQADGVIMDELTEIVLNIDDDQHWRYYFVDHRNRLLFWIDPVKPREDLNTDVQGISEYSHIRYLVEAQYWYASSGGLLDMMTTDSSSSPFTQDELAAILDLVNSLKDDEEIANPYSIWVIARLLSFFTENQFLNFCGQPCARLNADTPLFGQQTWNRSKVFKIVNVFLFGSPNEHADRLQRVWVDGIIILPRWKDFINRLTTELARYTIFSTVMLAVNFSFLAVPGVTTPGAPATNIQIIIYCSTVSTIGSIVFSFVLLNVYSDPGLMVAGPAAEAMRTLGQTNWGTACLAITHSLPIACLVWSIALFSTALAIQIFGPKEYQTVATLGVECLILVLFGLVSARVTRLFSKSDDGGGADDSDPDSHGEKGLSPAASQHDIDIEQGTGTAAEE